MFSSTAIILWIALPILAWAFRRMLPLISGHPWMLYIGTVIAGSLLYVGAVRLVDAELEQALYRFDLDGDRSFSSSEMTPEAEDAMRRLSTDTGRTFAPIVAAPVTFVWVTLWFLVLSGGSWILGKVRGSGNENQAEQ
jgi:hypothetical protein